jgi:demethylmenaquinone methyltransferase/2-methoxy-6-polyprenyl-1,4-benzoquinol methylase
VSAQEAPQNPYIRSLLDANPLREPLLRSVVQALRLPVGSHGLDAGCGIGLQTLLLADAVGVNGHVTGVDIEPELLAFAEALTGQTPHAAPIAFRQGDIHQLPFAESTFDWAWSADCVGYPAGDLLPTLHALRRVVRPGGSIVILGWTTQQVLPGYPLLEAWLNAECSGYRRYLESESPDRNFLRIPYALERAGLDSIQAQTFVADVQAPLNDGQRIALIRLFEMLWQAPTTPDVKAHWGEYERLCKPESPEFILNQPAYYGFFTYTVFRGTVPVA